MFMYVIIEIHVLLNLMINWNLLHNGEFIIIQINMMKVRFGGKKAFLFLRKY
jgi:hypothetical protein